MQAIIIRINYGENQDNTLSHLIALTIVFDIQASEVGQQLEGHATKCLNLGLVGDGRTE